MENVALDLQIELIACELLLQTARIAYKELDKSKAISIY